MKTQLRARNNYLEIKEILKTTSSIIVGVDEVGRGCIAGPVCAGVVVFKAQQKSKIKKYIDSKLIDEIKREDLAAEIKAEHFYALGWATVEEVDQLNIRQASLLAMNRAVTSLMNSEKLCLSECLLLVDGLDSVPNLEGSRQRNVIKGDTLVRQISAASIVAKVARDHAMKEISSLHPEYGFAKHKGYGTEEHRHAIQKFGITIHHRKTFAGVKEYVQRPVG